MTGTALQLGVSTRKTINVQWLATVQQYDSLIRTLTKPDVCQDSHMPQPHALFTYFRSPDHKENNPTSGCALACVPRHKVIGVRPGAGVCDRWAEARVGVCDPGCDVVWPLVSDNE